MTLRSIKLSSIWDNVFGRMLNDVQPVSDATTIKKWILPIQPAHKADRTLPTRLRFSSCLGHSFFRYERNFSPERAVFRFFRQLRENWHFERDFTS